MTTLTLTAAVKKYEVDRKRLLGKCFVDCHGSPFVVDQLDDGDYVILDDWALRNTVADLRNANKSLSQSE
jgi:hypothetical protein